MELGSLWPPSDYKEFRNDMILTEAELEDEEGNTQAVGTLTGATDDPFYQAASYDFSIMRFRQRGYNTEYTSTSINGINFNDAVRGRFNYSMTGGLNQAFRNKSVGMGLEATSFAFGEIGGCQPTSRPMPRTMLPVSAAAWPTPTATIAGAVWSPTAPA